MEWKNDFVGAFSPWRLSVSIPSKELGLAATRALPPAFSMKMAMGRSSLVSILETIQAFSQKPSRSALQNTNCLTRNHWFWRALLGLWAVECCIASHKEVGFFDDYQDQGHISGLCVFDACGSAGPKGHQSIFCS